MTECDQHGGEQKVIRMIDTRLNVFIFFSAVPNRFKYRQIAFFRYIRYIRYILLSSISLKLHTVLNTIRMQALDTLFLICSLKLQIVSNTVRVNALEKLFSKFSLRLQIVLESVYHILKVVSAVP